MRVIDTAQLDALTAAARESGRLRQNLNLHHDYAEPCQRLLNAVEPGSYVRPHRHCTPPKPESFAVLRGRLAVLSFGDDGEVRQSVILGRPYDAWVVDIPAGQWHSVLALEPGTVFFETKPGPYSPLADKDWAPWAPEESAADAEDYLARLLQAVLERAER